MLKVGKHAKGGEVKKSDYKKIVRGINNATVLYLSKSIAKQIAEYHELFVVNWKYADCPDIEMVDGELGYLFTPPHFIRIVVR